MNNGPLHTFTSHIAGKNAKVAIHLDRIEWSRTGMSGGKLTAGVMTMGASLLATGVSSGKATEMIPVKNIASVTTKRDGMINTKVVVVASGNNIDFRVSHSEAKTVAQVLQQLVLGNHPAQQTSSTTGPSAPAPTEPVKEDFMAQLQQLGSLRDSGILSEEEFSAKKAELLGRL